MKCLYAAETWTLTQTDRRRLEAFEMWIWRRMEKISWLDKVTNEEVLRRVAQEMQLRLCVYCMKETWNITIKSMSATLTMKKLFIV